MVYHRYDGGWIELICGSMFSGKTEELIRRLKRAEIAKQKVQVFKPKLDDRYHSAKLSSQGGSYYEATVVVNAAEIASLVHDDIEVVAIDEVQFFDWTVAELCDQLADQGLRVILAGLDMDFRGEPFGPMPLLMAQAEAARAEMTNWAGPSASSMAARPTMMIRSLWLAPVRFTKLVVGAITKCPAIIIRSKQFESYRNLWQPNFMPDEPPRLPDKKSQAIFSGES